MKAETEARTDTRKRILDIAEELLLTRGFNAFSYQHISRELGVRNAAIHYHFPHKTDLGTALVERYTRRLERFIEQHGEASATAQLERFFELADAYFRNDRQVCPSGILTVELHTLPVEMQVAACRFIEVMRQWAERIATLGQVEGSMHFAGTPAAMGLTMLATLQGGLQLARIEAAWLNSIKQQIRCLLGLAD